MENGPCKTCGSKENLEVDHVDMAKKITHRVWSWSEPRRLLELTKCQVLCENCHKTKTSEDMNWSLHGRPSMYSHGCRTMYEVEDLWISAGRDLED